MTCPKCSAVRPIVSIHEQAKPGDADVCRHCGQFVQYDEDMELIILSHAELTAQPTQTQIIITKLRGEILARNKRK